MAIYRIFPDKDTAIYTEQLTGNSGKDEILELGGYPSSIDGVGQSSRILMKFTDSDIQDVVNNKIGHPHFSSSIKLAIADASELPVDYKVYAYPIYIPGNAQWDNGVGKFADQPVNTSGASWVYRSGGLVDEWSITGFSTLTTASFSDAKQGGGNWYTGSKLNGAVDESMEFIQSHSIYSTHDLDINVTAAVRQIYTGSLPNKGFIVKLEDRFENYTSSSIRLKYFGKDTNTIYPPFLEFGWDDSLYNTGSLSVLDTDISIIDVKNNKGRYVDSGKQRFRLTARPQYPPRTFTTSSVYLTNYALPTASYWGLRDENTEEMVVDYSTDFTKISCDATGPYFDIYMEGLQPERYYRILVKTELDSSNIVVDNSNIFKVVRNG
tara:strand:+ start:8884 stop:10023 length:1140 start_codon:yes stop_codon:yes gene_type:complete